MDQLKQHCFNESVEQTREQQRDAVSAQLTQDTTLAPVMAQLIALETQLVDSHQELLLAQQLRSKAEARIKELQSQQQTTKMALLQTLKEQYPESKQACTCDPADDDGIPTSERSTLSLKCLRHPQGPARFYHKFPNKGCFYCNYTDCSLWGC